MSSQKFDAVDVYPELLNAEAIVKEFKTDIDIFEGYPQDYKLSGSGWTVVDTQGNVKYFECVYGDNVMIFRKMESEAGKLKFKPAIKDGQAVESLTLVRYSMKLGE